MKDPMLGDTKPLAAIEKKKSPRIVTILGETLPLIAAKKSTSREPSLFGETLPLAAVKKKRKKLTRKGLIIRLGILLVMLFLMTYGIIFGVVQYQQIKLGVQHLRNAETLLTGLQKNPFNIQSIQKAQQELSSASQIFQQVNGPISILPGISMIGSAHRLLPLAIEGSQAGVLVCQTLNLLIPILKDPMNANGPKLTQADLTTTDQNVQQIQVLLNLMVNQVNQLQPSDLQINPSLGKLAGIFHKDGPALLDAVSQARGFLSVAPVLLGVSTPTNYLLEIMDSTELRPGGGFIGNYGTLTLANGHVSKIFMTDVDLLDKPFFNAGKRTPYPPQYNWFPLSRASWWLENSNLDASFPANAQNGEQNYTKEQTWQGGVVPLQGVIAITPWFMEGLLKITGPVSMQPDFPDTVTYQNLVEEIHLHQLGTGHASDLIPSQGGSSMRKHFTSVLAQDLIAHVHQLLSSSSAMSSLEKLATNSLKAGDIQIYLNPPAAENVLQHYQLSGSVLSPPGDGIYVVDANAAANKANQFITYTMNDQVTLDAKGNAVHHTTLTYAWVLPGHLYGLPNYQEYAQVYVPAGSTLQSQTGWQPRGQSQIYNREVWQGWFQNLTAGNTLVVTLNWTTPKAAQFDGQVWHYNELLQKQPGDTWTDNVQVNLPACATMKSVSGGLVAKAGRAPEFSGSLLEDKSLEVDYTCK